MADPDAAEIDGEMGFFGLDDGLDVDEFGPGLDGGNAVESEVVAPTGEVQHVSVRASGGEMRLADALRVSGTASLVVGRGEEGRRAEVALRALGADLAAAAADVRKLRGVDRKRVRAALDGFEAAVSPLFDEFGLAPDLDAVRLAAGAAAEASVLDQAKVSVEDRLREAESAGNGLALHPAAEEAVAAARAFLSEVRAVLPSPCEVVIDETIRSGEASVSAWRDANEAAYGGDAERDDTGLDGAAWQARPGVEWVVRLGKEHGRPLSCPLDGSEAERARAAARSFARAMKDAEQRGGWARLAADLLDGKERAAGVVSFKAEPVDMDELARANPRLSFEDLVRRAADLQAERDARVKASGPGIATSGPVRLGGGVETRGATEAVELVVQAAQSLAQAEFEREPKARTLGELAARLREQAKAGAVPLDASLRRLAMVAAARAQELSEGEIRTLRSASRVALLLDPKTDPAVVEGLLRAHVASMERSAVEVVATGRAIARCVEDVGRRFDAERAGGARRPKLNVLVARSVAGSLDGAQVALGRIHGGLSDYDRTLLRASARGLGVVATDSTGRQVGLSRVKESLDQARAARRAEEGVERQRKAGRWEDLGVQRVEKGGVAVFATRPEALSERLLSVVGRLSPKEVEAAKHFASSNGFAGIAWFASPNHHEALPPPGLAPKVIGSAALGAFGRPSVEWKGLVARPGFDPARTMRSSLGSVEVASGRPLVGGHPQILSAIVLPGRRGAEQEVVSAERRIQAITPGEGDRVVVRTSNGRTPRLCRILDEVSRPDPLLAGLSLDEASRLTLFDRASGRAVLASSVDRAAPTPTAATHALLRGPVLFADGMAAVRRPNGTYAVLTPGRTTELGREEEARTVAVAIARDAGGSAVGLWSKDAAAEAAIEEVGAVARRELERLPEDRRLARMEAIGEACVVGRRVPRDLELDGGMVSSNALADVPARELEAYIGFARAVGSDVVLVGEQERMLREAARAQGLSVLTARQMEHVEAWRDVSAVAGAARAEGAGPRFPRALARHAAERLGLDEAGRRALEMRLYAYPTATAPGRELALAAEAMLPEAKREAFLAAFDGGRMRPASLGRVEAETFAQRSVPPDLAEASGRIASLAGKFEDVNGSTSTLAQAMLERASSRATAGGGEVSPSVRRIASELRHLSGRAEDHRDGACAQFLIDKALSSGDHEGAMKFLRAFQFGQLASGREIVQEKGRHADFSR